MLSAFAMQGSLNTANAGSRDIVDCMPGIAQIEELNRPANAFPPALQKHLSCAKQNGLSKNMKESSLSDLCLAHQQCNDGKNMSNNIAYDILGNFIAKKRLEDEMPRSMIYSAVKEFLKKENAFPSAALGPNGNVSFKCATNEYNIKEAANWRKDNRKGDSCNNTLFEKSGRSLYKSCGKLKECFGPLDDVVKKHDQASLTISTLSANDFIKRNTDIIIEHYENAKAREDEYIEKIRQELQTNPDVKAVLKKYKNESPVIMAMFMPGDDRAKGKMDAKLEPLIQKEIASLKQLKTKNASEFKAAFKKFQINVGRGMFDTCLKEDFFPFNAIKICDYSSIIAGGNLDIISIHDYKEAQLYTLLRELSGELTGSNEIAKDAVYLVCKIKKANDYAKGRKAGGTEQSEFLTTSVSTRDSGYNKFIDEFGSDSSSFSANSAIDSEQDNAIINQTVAALTNTENVEEDAIVQANNQNLKGQNTVDSQAFINNFPIDNYSGIANDYVNKSYINRAEKLSTDKESAINADSSLSKQYNDIEAKIAEAEERLKDLQQGLGEVGKNKNQPVVSNGVSREKTQSSSEIEELLKEIKELKAQNNEIKEKLVTKANTEKVEKVAEKQAGSFNNSPGLAFSSGNKNDYKFESKPVEIKPTSSYSSSQGSSQSMRAPSSLGAAKLGSQASGAILSAVDNKADAVTPARAVTRVDSFNSESARKTITSRINEINKNTKEMEQSKATIEIDGQLKEVISFEVLDEKGQKKLVVVELKDGKVAVDKDGNPIYVSQDMTDDSIIITKKGKDENSVKKLQSQADVKRVDELKLQKGRSAERVKLNDLTRSAVKAKP